MNYTNLLLLSAVIFSLGYYLFSAYCTLAFFARPGKGEKKRLEELPPVSIIKPVAGVENGYLENFISFCTQDYPEYEIIFTLADREDPAIGLLETLEHRFPQLNIRRVIVSRNKGPNYKVGNLIEAVRNARYETLMISDSDMRVEPGYLKEVVGALLQDGVGLVTCLYRKVNVDSIPAALECLSIQTDFIPNVLLDDRLEGISYGLGATICTTKKVLTSLGGLEPLLDYLADDYQLGYRVHRQGYRVGLSSYLVDDHSTSRDFKDYFLHQLRWAITYRVCRPVGHLASIMTHGVSLACLFLIATRFSPAAAGLFLLICTVRLLSSAHLNRAAIHNQRASRYLWLIPIKDLLNTIIWFLSLFVSTVYWKQRRFQVLRGGRILEV